MEPSLSGMNVSCLLCEQTFDAVERLDEHLSAHFPQPEVSQSHICDLCGRRMRSSLELQQHYKRFHEAHVASTDGHFHCQLCDKVFLLQDHLNEHVKIEHSSVGYRSDEKISEWKQTNHRCFDVATVDKLDPILCPPPKKKYPPRSPFFNP
ncbi:hypothetical protein KR084_011549 [Drosophila pseudotakahashii]|nr:hypothetical protein KR084_011549 [Drosophila pseudotakahashii]